MAPRYAVAKDQAPPRATVRASRLSGAVAQVTGRGNRFFSFGSRGPRPRARSRCSPIRRLPIRLSGRSPTSSAPVGPSSPHRTRSSASTKKVKRRTDVVGIHPSEASIVRLIGAGLLEQNRRVATATPLHVGRGHGRARWPRSRHRPPRNFHPRRPDPWPLGSPANFTTLTGVTALSPSPDTDA